MKWGRSCFAFEGFMSPSCFPLKATLLWTLFEKGENIESSLGFRWSPYLAVCWCMKRFFPQTLHNTHCPCLCLHLNIARGETGQQYVCFYPLFNAPYPGGFQLSVTLNKPLLIVFDVWCYICWALVSFLCGRHNIQRSRYWTYVVCENIP